MSWNPTELFITQKGRHSKNQVCLYKDKNSYVVVDYMEVDEYLEKNYKRTPMEFDEQISDEIYTPFERTPDSDVNLKVKIDRLKAKIKDKEECCK